MQSYALFHYVHKILYAHVMSSKFWNWYFSSAFPPSTAEGRLRKFYIVKEQMSRSSAEEQCTTNNTGLVTVYDHQDNMKLSNLIKETFTGGNPSGWIGTRAGNRSKKWSNGDDVTFNRWENQLYCDECYWTLGISPM